MSRAAGALVARVLVGGALVAGCAVQPSDVGVRADCAPADGHVNPLLVLMAQAVPTASQVPCVGVVPSAWRRSTVEVRDGRASFAFSSSSTSGPDGPVLTVVMTRHCDVSGATEVPSDEPGTSRFERLKGVAGGYAGERFYLYPGGCTTLDFDLPAEGRVQQVGEASLAVGFVSRTSLREGVERRSRGRLVLDPEPPS